MDTEAALAFSASAPFIAAILGLAKGWIAFEPRTISPVAIVLALLWGALLWVSDRWEGDPALWLVTGVTVGFAASGMQGFARSVSSDVFRIGPNAPPPGDGSP